MTSEEEFIAWLKDDGNQQPYVLDEGKNKKYVLKVPKAKQFLYLYQQDCYGEQGIERNGSFSYTGFYNKENEMIYNSGIRFVEHCPNHIQKKTIRELFKSFTDKVKRRIEEIVGKNLDYYANLELSADKKDNLETYATDFMANKARSYRIKLRRKVYAKRSDDS